MIPNRQNIEHHQSPDDERNNCDLLQKFSFDHFDHDDDIVSDDDFYDCVAEAGVENGRVSQHIRF